MKNLAILILISILTLSCSVKKKLNSSSTYIKKSTELITQILSKKNDCDCILNSICNNVFLEDYKIDNPENNYRNELSKYLKVKNTKELNNIIENSKNFDIRKSIIHSDIKIIDQNELSKINRLNSIQKLKIYRDKCPNGRLLISKPIFNKSFDIAVIFIGKTRGPLSGHGGYYTYKLENENWTSGKGFGFYIN